VSFADFDLPETWIDRKTAIDHLEPLPDEHDDLRDFAVKSVAILNAFASRIESGFAQGTVQSVAVQFWSVAYALGLNCAAGISMTDRAVSLGVQRATISKGARAFCLANDLPPSFMMKAEAAAESYCDSRVASIQRANGAHEGADLPHERAKPFKTPPALP
jgi:hypothetical protein